MRRSTGVIVVAFLVAVFVEAAAGEGRAAQQPAAPAAKPAAAAGPVLVVQTAKGVIEIRL
jgi:hypothetical protein